MTLNKLNTAISVLWLLCVGQEIHRSIWISLNLLWLLSFFQEKESDKKMSDD